MNKATRSIISWIHGEFIEEIQEMFSLNRSPLAAPTFGRLDFFPSVASSDRIGPCNRWGQDVVRLGKNMRQIIKATLPGRTSQKENLEKFQREHFLACEASLGPSTSCAVGVRSVMEKPWVVNVQAYLSELPGPNLRLRHSHLSKMLAYWQVLFEGSRYSSFSTYDEEIRPETTKCTSTLSYTTIEDGFATF